MDRVKFYALMAGDGSLDYEIYLNTPTLLNAQKEFQSLCNADELQFQIVHQVEELWMKLAAYTLLDVDEHMAAGRTHRVTTLMGRVHQIFRLMIDQLGLLETMSPKEYQEIRLQLGNGSGQESPGFRVLLQMPKELWATYVRNYLEPTGRDLDHIYDAGYAHDDAYVIAESLAEFDSLFQKFRYHHMQLIRRSIGADAKSLKGRSVQLLEEGTRKAFFPELWAVRARMTDSWGGEYGVIRDSIGAPRSGSH